MRPTNTGNISVTASDPCPVLAHVAQALLPVHYAWNASATAPAGVPVPPTVVIETLTKGRYDRGGNDKHDFVFGKNSP
jgi:hypothetical protein